MTIEKLQILGTEEQGSLAWKRARLGVFTASSIANLMSRGRSKSEEWGDKAITEMAEKAAERRLAYDVVGDDEKLQSVLDLQCRENAAMRHGHEWEDTARTRYEIETGQDVATCGLLSHPSVPYLAYSPDGCVVDNRGTIRGLVEVKCPSTLKTWMRYRWLVRDGETLKREKPEYYWQVQTGMAVTGAKWADMVFYCPWMEDGLWVVRVNYDEEAGAELVERVDRANEYIIRMDTAKSAAREKEQEQEPLKAE